MKSDQAYSQKYRAKIRKIVSIQREKSDEPPPKRHRPPIEDQIEFRSLQQASISFSPNK
jgi:hypothetical protein